MKRRAGFTLIEVMIAIAILALGLSIVFSSSVMAARATAHSRMLTNGAMYAQCRMTGVEAYLRQNQLPEADQTYEDPPDTGGLKCCDPPFTCAARVEIIQLPDPVDVSQSAGDRLLNAASGAAHGSSYNGIASGDGGLSSGLGSLLGGADGGAGGNPMDQLAGALGALGSMSGTGGAAGADPMAGLGGAGGSGGIGGLASAGAPSLQSMASVLLAGIYPTIKPLLEGAIRKVTVTVSWTEGTRPFNVTVIEYFTNPGQTIASGDQLNAIDRLTGGAGGNAGTGTMGSSGAAGTAGTSSTTSTTTGVTH